MLIIQFSRIKIKFQALTIMKQEKIGFLRNETQKDQFFFLFFEYLNPESAGLTGKKPRTKRASPNTCIKTANTAITVNFLHVNEDESIFFFFLLPLHFLYVCFIYFRSSTLGVRVGVGGGICCRKKSIFCWGVNLNI